MHVPLRAHFPAQSVWASVRTDRCVRVRNRGWRSRCAQVGSAPPERRSLRRIRSEPGKAPGCVFGRGGPRRAGFGSACPLSAPTDPPPLTDARETLCKSIARRHCDGRLPPGDAPPRSGRPSAGSPAQISCSRFWRGPPVSTCTRAPAHLRTRAPVHPCRHARACLPLLPPLLPAVLRARTLACIDTRIRRPMQLWPI